MSCFHLFFFLEHCLYETLSSWECLSYTSRHFRLVPIEKSSALCDNCLAYSTSLISNNYLGSNKRSVDNNFHSLVNLLFPITLLFRLMSVWNIIQLRMSIFTLHVIFALVPIQKSSAYCDICLVYSSSLVSSNYLVSNNCSAQNNFHSLVNLLLPIALLFRLMSVWNIIQLIMSIFTLHVISVVVSIQKSSALWDYCLVYSTSLISNNYLGSNKCSVDNNLHFSRECLVSICFSF